MPESLDGEYDQSDSIVSVQLDNSELASRADNHVMSLHTSNHVCQPVSKTSTPRHQRVA